MNCIALDDEDFALRHLVVNNIRKVPYLNLLGVFSNPQEALIFLQTTPVDLIFLDIEMPDYPIDGIDFMKIMKPEQQYILTTGHPQYALASYEHNVIDFLHKPFSFERFAKAIQKAQQLLKGPLQELADKRADYIYVKSERKLQRLFFDQICYVEGERNYATIFRPSDTLSTKITLNVLEEQLPPNEFCRVHKSFIAALQKVELIEKDHIGITQGQTMKRLPLSGQYKKSFLQIIESKRLLNGV